MLFSEVITQVGVFFVKIIHLDISSLQTGSWNGWAGADLCAATDHCCILFSFSQILEFDSPTALLADENSRFRSMIEASESQNRWKTPEPNFAHELRRYRVSYTHTKKENLRNPAVMFDMLRWQKTYEPQSVWQIWSHYANNLKTSCSLLPCQKSYFLYGPNNKVQVTQSNDSHDSTLYFMKMHKKMCSTSFSSAGDKWNFETALSFFLTTSSACTNVLFLMCCLFNAVYLKTNREHNVWYYCCVGHYKKAILYVVHLVFIFSE